MAKNGGRNCAKINNTWIIRFLVNELVIDPATQRMILKIVGFYIIGGPHGMNWSLVGTIANAFNIIFFNYLLFLGGGHGQQPATPISIMKKRSSNPIELRRSSGAVKVDLSSADKTIRRPGSEPDLNNSPIRSSLRQTASGKALIKACFF